MFKLLMTFIYGAIWAELGLDNDNLKAILVHCAKNKASLGN